MLPNLIPIDLQYFFYIIISRCLTFECSLLHMGQKTSHLRTSPLETWVTLNIPEPFAALPWLQFYSIISHCMARLFNPGAPRKSHCLQFRQVGREHRQVLRPSAIPSSDGPESLTQCGVQSVEVQLTSIRLWAIIMNLYDQQYDHDYWFNEWLEIL